MRSHVRHVFRKAALVAGVGMLAISPSVAAQDATPVPYEAPDDLAEITGQVEADGSSTVGPLTNAIIEGFSPEAPGIELSNGISGSGGGFNRFVTGETQISNASREISEEELELAEENGIEWYRFDVAYDGITVVVSAENDFIDSMTTEDLATLWSQEGEISTWADLNPEWPEESVELYAPGTDSGTFDLFGELVLDDDQTPRMDYTPSEDDNVLVQGVANSPYAMAYFGYSYYEENQETLSAVAIDDGDGPVGPSLETIGSGEYSPFARNLFLYVNAEMLQTDPALQEFMRFYLATADQVAQSVGYTPMPGEPTLEQQERLEAAIAGDLPTNDQDVDETDEDEATPAA